MTTRIPVSKEAVPPIRRRPAGVQAKWLAVLRIATGLIFLWAFLDKLFGLGYATPRRQAWIDGGSPTQGFLNSGDVGPFGARTTRSPAPGGRTGCSCSACSASASR